MRDEETKNEDEGTKRRRDEGTKGRRDEEIYGETGRWGDIIIEMPW